MKTRDITVTVPIPESVSAIALERLDDFFEDKVRGLVEEIYNLEPDDEQVIVSFSEVTEESLEELEDEFMFEGEE